MSTELNCHLVDFAAFPSIRTSLALGYLQAYAQADRRLAGKVSFRQQCSYIADPMEKTWRSIEDRLRGQPAGTRVVGFTNYFWSRPLNLRIAGRIRSAFPDALIVFGGNDVTNQGSTVLGEDSPVDVVANGEGEAVFANLLAAYLGGRDAHALHDVRGIAFRERTGTIVATGAEPRIQDLDSIPSPFHSGACSGGDIASSMVVMCEFSRGCPFKCSFCYWGAAVGTRVRRFSSERIRQDLDVLFAHMRPGATLYIADANFGMTDSDIEAAQVISEVARRRRKPIRVFSNWAKNTNRRVIETASILFRNRLIYNVTLSAQSLNPEVLEIAQRKNIPFQYYGDLHKRFRSLGIPTYTELILGMPGESYESFLAGIENVISVGGAPVIYPLLLLNNTDYNEAWVREKYAIRSRFLPYQMFDTGMLAETVVGHASLSYQEWIRGMGLTALVPVLQGGLLKFLLRQLHQVHGLSYVGMIDGLLDYCLEGKVRSSPLFQQVFTNLIESWKSPQAFDRELLRSILGQISIQHGTPHYQALMRVLVDDAAATRSLIEELGGVLRRQVRPAPQAPEWGRWIEYQQIILEAVGQAAKGEPGEVPTRLGQESLRDYAGSGIVIRGDQALQVRKVFEGYSFNLFIYYLQYGCIDTLEMFESTTGSGLRIPESTPRMTSGDYWQAPLPDSNRRRGQGGDSLDRP